MKILENLYLGPFGILKWSYIPSKKKIASSPLDQPLRSVIFAMICGIALAASLAFLAIDSLLGAAKTELDQIRFSNIHSQESIEAELLPGQRMHNSPNADEVKKHIDATYEAGLSLEAFTKLLASTTQNNSLDNDALAQSIIGDVTGALWPSKKWLFPILEQQSAEHLVADLGFPKTPSENDYALDSAEYQRRVLVVTVLELRSVLTEHGGKPLRIAIGLAGYIQWIILTLGSWCMLLLVLMRLPWAFVQLQLSKVDRLWYLFQLAPKNRGAFRHPRVEKIFLPQRLMKEAGQMIAVERAQGKPFPSTRTVIRNRIKSFRDSIDQGEYELINFLIWAIPTCGFLGTILGIIGAMEAAALIVKATNSLEQAQAIRTVTSNLGMAFDTTFVALVCVIPLSFLLAITRKTEADLLENLESKGIETLSNLWKGVLKDINSPKQPKKEDLSHAS